MDLEESNYDMDNVTLPNQLDESSPLLFDPRQKVPFSPTSPGKRSPGRPKTMKEYEDDVANLKKENFSLKVRIYFLEQHRADLNLPKDVEEMRNLYTDLKIEHELQKKDLDAKNDLVLVTYKALDAQKQELEAVKGENQELLKRMDSMEKELKDYHLRFMESSITHLDDTNALYAVTFGLNNKPEIPREDNQSEQKIKELENDLSKERERVSMLEEEIAALNEKSASDKKNIQKLQLHIENMEEKLKIALEDREMYERLLVDTQSMTSKIERGLLKKSDEVKEKNNELEKWKAVAAELRKQLSEVELQLQEIQERNNKSQSEKQIKILYAENEKLKKEIRQLQQQQLEKKSSRSRSSEQGREHAIRLQELQHRLEELHRENESLKVRDYNSRKFVQSTIKDNKILTKEIEELKGTVRKLSGNHTDSSKEEVSRLLEARTEMSADKEILISELQSKIEDLNRIINEKDDKLQELKNKLDSLPNNSQSEGYSRDCNQGVLGDNSSKLENEAITRELEEKNSEIESLKKDLRKKTFNLQGLVNKELWDKNREIEKLNKLCERQHVEMLSLEKQLRECHLTYMQEKVSGFGSPMGFQRGIFDDKENLQPVADPRTQIQRLMEEKRLLQRKVEELQARLLNTPERDKESEQIQTLRSEKEQAEKQRKEAVNACMLLTTRLQELADFLDSLLPSLCGKKRKFVQQAVERSRELSRSLSLAAEESSLMHCSTWTDLQPSLVIPLLPDISTVDFWSGDEGEEPFSGNEDNKPLEGTLVEEGNKKDEAAKFQMEKSSEKNPFLTSVFDFDLKTLLLDENHGVLDENPFSENIADITEGSLVETCSDQNLLDSKTCTRVTLEVKSVNIGKITLTSKKKDGKSSHVTSAAGEASKPKEQDGLSECETWSEPDRDVSYARMGLKEDSNVLNKSTQFGFNDTSETADSIPKSPLSRRGSEIQRLQRKIRSLEQVNAALRSELVILHQLTPPTMTRQDKATSIELSRQSSFSVPSHLLEEIRNQREKLEASLFHNDYIRRQLESTVSSLQRNQGDQEKVLLIKLKEVTSQLQLAECEAAELKVEKENLHVKLESLQSTLQQTSDELKEKQNAWQELEKETACRLKEIDGNYSVKLSQNEQKCLELEKRALELEKEKNELLSKIAECNNQISELTREIENHVIEGKKNKQLNEELNVRVQQINRQKDELQRLTAEQEQLLADAERERQELATQLIARDREVSELSKRLSNVELTSGELEAALRSQLELATQQCAQFETKIRDLDCCNKRRESVVVDLQRRLDSARFAHSEAVLQYTRVANDNIRLQQELRTRQHNNSANQVAHVERMRGELERRVAELEAVNVELEAKLASLNVAQHPFSDYDTDAGSSVAGSPRARTHPPPLTLPPSSPRAFNLPSSPLRPLPLTSPSRSHDLTSDYLSDQDAGLSSPQTQSRSLWFPTSPHSHMSASPDLGIESDHGRFSSLETQPPKSTTVSIRGTPVKELMKLEEENTQLRLNLQKTRHALEETLAQLTAANQHKRQYEAQLSAANQHKAKVERAICRQLHKTHSILKKARVNLEEEGKGERC